MEDNKIQAQIDNSGDNEGAIIGVQNNNNYGLSAVEAIQIYNTLFQSNFPILEQIARQTAEARTIELRDEIFAELERMKFKEYGYFADPDIQYVLIQAEKEYARRGGEELRKLLCTLLIRRLQSNKSLMRICLNEAINIIPLLTPKHISLLSLKFIVVHTKSPNVDSLEHLVEYIENILIPFACYDYSAMDYRHLTFCRCGQDAKGRYLGVQLAYHYPDLFTFKGDPLHEEHISYRYANFIILDGDNETTLDKYILDLCPKAKRLFDVYDSWITGFNLSSVGMMIGALNQEAQSNEALNLEIWFGD